MSLKWVLFVTAGASSVAFLIYALAILNHYNAKYGKEPVHVDSGTKTPIGALKRLKIESTVKREDLSDEYYTETNLTYGGIVTKTQTKIRGRMAGGSSSGKNSYKLKTDDALINNDGDNKRYTLRGAKWDSTMLRDWLGQELWKRMHPGKQDNMYYEFVVFEYNDEDLGVYLLITSPKDNVLGSQYVDADDFCFLRVNEKGHPPISWLPDPHFEIKDPDIGKMAEDHREKVAAIIKGFYDNDIGYVDLDSWAAEFIFAEMARDWDVHRNSFYMYTANGKLHFGPQWDFDGAFASNQNAHACQPFNRPEGFMLQVDENHYFNQKGLIQKSAAAERVIAMWKNFSKRYSAADLVNLVEQQYRAMKIEVESSYERWGGYGMLMNTPLFTPKLSQKRDAGGHPLLRPKDSLKEEVDWLKEFIKKRYEWIDEHINELKSPKNATALTVKNWGAYFIVFVLLATICFASWLAVGVWAVARVCTSEDNSINSKDDAFFGAF